MNGTQLFGDTDYPTNLSIISLRTTGNVAADRFGLDRGYTSLNRFWIGELGELLIYNSPLSTAQISNIEYYLNEKWGLGHSLAPDPMIILDTNRVVDTFGEGNDLTFAVTQKMHRAVTRGKI